MPRRIIYVLAAAGLISIASLVIGQALLSFSDDFTRLEADTPEFQGYGDFLHHQNDIFNSTLGLQNIFVVGLPSRTDRRDGMALAASLSNLEIEFIDGVNGADVPDNAVPQSKSHGRLANASVGSWRAHMNAIQEVVHRNLSSALVFEDDVDWDVRIKDQLLAFSSASRALTQPLTEVVGGHKYADWTYPSPAEEPLRSIPDLRSDRLPRTVPPDWSPYGDNWDVLWLGHCGMQFPAEGNPSTPRGRVIRHDDETVAETRYLFTLSPPFTLAERYPQHTRAYHHTQEGVCSLAYAVNQRGARRLLHEVALQDVSDAFDILLRFFCEGSHGRRRHTCLTTQPGLFQHHRPAGPTKALSDIGDHGDGWNEESMTDMVRWSVRLNANAIMDGRMYHDQYPNSAAG